MVKDGGDRAEILGRVILLERQQMQSGMKGHRERHGTLAKMKGHSKECGGMERDGGPTWRENAERAHTDLFLLA